MCKDQTSSNTYFGCNMLHYLPRKLSWGKALAYVVYQPTHYHNLHTGLATSSSPFLDTVLRVLHVLCFHSLQEDYEVQHRRLLLHPHTLRPRGGGEHRPELHPWGGVPCAGHHAPRETRQLAGCAHGEWPARTGQGNHPQPDQVCKTFMHTE